MLLLLLLLLSLQKTILDSLGPRLTFSGVDIAVIGSLLSPRPDYLQFVSKAISATHQQSREGGDGLYSLRPYDDNLSDYSNIICLVVE